jgi:hypothetical protein
MYPFQSRWEAARSVRARGCTSSVTLALTKLHQIENDPSARTGFDSLRAIHAEDPQLLKDLEIYVDGGCRRGSEVLQAIALGARGVGLGRPFLWAQAAYGEKGVIRAVRSEWEAPKTWRRSSSLTDNPPSHGKRDSNGNAVAGSDAAGSTTPGHGRVLARGMEVAYGALSTGADWLLLQSVIQRPLVLVVQLHERVRVRCEDLRRADRLHAVLSHRP